MSRSLAPSPTAIASAGVRPRRAAISCSASALAARPRIGSATSPVRRPSCFDQVIGAVLVKAEHGGDRDGEDVEAAGDERGLGAVAPSWWRPARVPPEASVRRLSMMRSTTEASRPFSRATRSRSAGSKAISPFIERAVMAATWSLRPTSSASSSMHSWSIMVESMSAIRIFLRRSSASWTTKSIGSAAERVAQARPSASSAAQSVGQGEIAGDAVGRARQWRLRRRPRDGHIRQATARAERRAGWEISVATSGIEKFR